MSDPIADAMRKDPMLKLRVIGMTLEAMGKSRKFDVSDLGIIMQEIQKIKKHYMLHPSHNRKASFGPGDKTLYATPRYDLGE